MKPVNRRRRESKTWNGEIKEATGKKHMKRIEIIYSIQRNNLNKNTTI